MSLPSDSLKIGFIVYDLETLRYVLIVSTHPEILALVLNADDKSIAPGDPIRIEADHLVRSDQTGEIITYPASVSVADAQREETKEMVLKNV